MGTNANTLTARTNTTLSQTRAQSVEVGIAPLNLPGTLTVPENAITGVVFAHGSGSSRLSPRNIAVAGALWAHGLATLLFDLLTPPEAQDRANVFNIPLLAQRLNGAIDFVRNHPKTSGLPIGLFGASTGAAAALVAAGSRPRDIAAVVSRGGRPDLAGDMLPRVQAPTLLIVGGDDTQVLALNRRAQDMLTCENELVVVEGATHLFEESGALEQVARLAAGWFERHQRGPADV